MVYLKLYLLIFKIALMSFGGAYSIWALIANEVVVDCRRGEHTAVKDAATPSGSSPEFARGFSVCRSDFATIIGIAEMLPGPQVNAISMLGFRHYGIFGMLVIVAALVTPGLLLVPLLRYIERRLGHPIHVQDFFAGAFLATLAILGVFFFQLAHSLTRGADGKALGVAALITVAFWLSFSYSVKTLIIATGGAVSGYLLLT